MIEPKNCPFKDRCYRYSQTKECENLEVCEKLFKLDYLYNESLLTDAQRKFVPIKAVQGEPDLVYYKKLQSYLDNIEKFVEEGKNVYIHSTNCGNGKTTWAIKFIQHYFEKIYYKTNLRCRALYINVPRFLLSLKDSISNHSDYIDHIKKNVLDADLVIWDEVAIKEITSYEHEHLLNLINTRLEEGKSNIYTSNLNPADLKEKLGERLYSRIINMSEDINFTGRDKRGLVK